MNRFDAPSEDWDLPADEEDLLIHRLLEGCASEADWHEVEQRNLEGLGVRVLETLRAEQRLRAALGNAFRVADGVELPRAPRLRAERRGWRSTQVLHFAWTGWAAALVVAALWWTQTASTPARLAAAPIAAELVTSHSLPAIERILMSKARRFPLSAGWILNTESCTSGPISRSLEQNDPLHPRAGKDELALAASALLER